MIIQLPSVFNKTIRCVIAQRPVFLPLTPFLKEEGKRKKEEGRREKQRFLCFTPSLLAGERSARPGGWFAFDLAIS